MNEVRQQLAKAVAAHQAGDFAAAEQAYKHVLVTEPNHFDALHLLGVLEAQRGNLMEADRLLIRALTANPRSAAALSHHGRVLNELGRREEALASFEKALSVNPGDVETLNNRGVALASMSRYDEALASYDRALALRPDYVQALNNRGLVLMSMKRLDDALASYDRALAIYPAYAAALFNRGNALRDLKRGEEAVASYDRALAIDACDVEALNNRGTVLRELRRDKEALASYDRALALKPDYPEALCNRGNLLLDSGRYEDAITDLRRALALDPDVDYILGTLIHCRMHIGDWSGLAKEIACLSAKLQMGRRASPPFPLLAISASAAEQLRAAQIWAADKNPPRDVTIWRGEQYRHDRIRLAYISAEFREQPTAYLLAELYELHDRKKFEVFGISIGPNDFSAMRDRLERAFDYFIEASEKSDHDIASLLRHLEIDISINLNGYFGGARTGIFALRPTPIQVSYVGYPGTMGVNYIDYLIADRRVVPEDERCFYSEKIVYLPETYQANDSKRRIAPRTPARIEAGLPDRGFVFCCFNTNYKITPEVFDVWMRLLRQVEGSVLWLIEGNAAVARNLRREAEKRGVAPARLVFAPRVKLEDHLARHRCADLFLDTLPCNAHTTASDALWAGLPVLTCLGTTFAGRVAASLLDALGLRELVTHSLTEYESRALELARDGEALAGIKAKLARNRETYPLFDSDRSRRHLEAAYETMWTRYQKGEPSASFAVEPIHPSR